MPVSLCLPLPCWIVTAFTARRAFIWPPRGRDCAPTSVRKFQFTTRVCSQSPQHGLRLPQRRNRFVTHCWWRLPKATGTCAELITQYKLREKAKGEGRATLEEIQAYAKGLVCLTGGAEGPLAAALASGGYDAAKNEVERLIQIFGPSNVYVELQRHFDRQEEFRNQAAVRIARKPKFTSARHEWRALRAA